MDNNAQADERLIQYLDGELTGEELTAFEQTLANSPELQVRLENLELAKMAAMHYGLRQQVASVHHHMMDELRGKQGNQNSGRIYSLLRFTMKIAAGLIVFMFLFGAYEWVNVSSAELAQNNYQPYELSVDRGVEGSSVIEKAYANHNFKTVIAELSKSPGPGEKDRFLGGQAYLSMHEPANAIREFNEVLLDPASHYRDDAEYYLALSYLQYNEPLKAQKLIDQIYNDKDHLYHDRVSYWTVIKLKLLILKKRGE
ncbi:hypothetical protein [Mucilaginibacter aquaedulcis]|uniref:hypothetical protein n=1 Tax=Mucilaginibacter aquaedulcis TaxID=1187081 RepID=UPI0025B2C546|nr:hypothetical protein [Mucilaginibacter aquaedulcis]MDN3548706.1 hypothetical protein [Mucilaginibacter aquaedulcis]